MEAQDAQRSGQPGFWAVVRSQHGVVTRRQLLDLGFTERAIKHRLTAGRLLPIWRGVYAVGRPELTQYGRWMAAVLACGSGAALSHECAGALLRILPLRLARAVDVSVPGSRAPRRPGIVVHRRIFLPGDVIRHERIPVTGAAWTLVDLATRVSHKRLEAAVNEADKRDLIDPEALRERLDELGRRPGVGTLKALLDRHTFTLTDTELERRFLPLARVAGLPMPVTQRYVNSFRVDFHWPELGLIVETDGLRYHRTPAQQARDRVRDQKHAAAGLTPLRFTRAQVRFDAAHVQTTLAAVARNLRSRSS